MITYNEQQKSFLLTGKGYSYAFFINQMNTLQHLHYGAPIFPSDMSHLYKIGSGDTQTPNPENFNRNLSFDYTPSEFGFYARGDYREPSAVIARKDGGQMSCFTYVSHEIFDGAPQLKGMPHARKGDKTLAVTVRDECTPVEITLFYTVSEDSTVLVRNASYKNVGDEPVQLKRAFSFCFDLPGGYEYKRMCLGGAWAFERQPSVVPVSHGVTRLQSIRGNSSHQTNPFIGILKEDCNEDSGECYSVALCYSGSYVLATDWAFNQRLRIHGGVSDFNFSWQLEKGEEFITPQAFLNYSANGLGELSRGYADFMRDYVIVPRFVRAPRPIVVNNWEATYFDFNNEKLFPIIDAAAELGVDTFVLDDGWFGKRDDDKSGLGDWFVNEKKLEGGLKTVINRCKEKGLKFGLWFEPEMISEDSDLYRAHPDYAIKMEGVTPVRSRNQLVLDFTRQEVVDHVYNVISKVLRENDISYVKWDMNRSITEMYTPSLPAERQGEFQHRFILGVFNLAERLTGDFPHIFFEGCAGGGGRFDAGMLYYFAQFWTSDDTDAYERTKIQWGTSFIAPLSTMSCHVSACPNHQTGRITPISSRAAIASLGPTGYELDLSILSEEEKEAVKQQIIDYKQVSELILNGDLYRHRTTLDGGEYFFVTVVSKDKSQAYAVGLRTHGSPCDFDHYVQIKGLDPDKIYHIPELDITASGKSLAGYGVLLRRMPDFGGWTWHINQVK